MTGRKSARTASTPSRRHRAIAVTARRLVCYRASPPSGAVVGVGAVGGEVHDDGVATATTSTTPPPPSCYPGPPTGAWRYFATRTAQPTPLPSPNAAPTLPTLLIASILVRILLFTNWTTPTTPTTLILMPAACCRLRDRAGLRTRNQCYSPYTPVHCTVVLVGW
jgi:hypothetical protein